MKPNEEASGWNAYYKEKCRVVDDFLHWGVPRLQMLWRYFNNIQEKIPNDVDPYYLVGIRESPREPHGKKVTGYLTDSIAIPNDDLHSVEETLYELYTKALEVETEGNPDPYGMES
ncbi:MAG: hypothetical protein JW932_12580 [Deltaproteobacteria bacterium]|nr:hypothetical protein [Deltaproteobacteria bacterium]